jgi:hypothetical protein
MSDILQQVYILDKERIKEWRKYYKMFNIFIEFGQKTFSNVKKEYIRNNNTITAECKRLSELKDIITHIYEFALFYVNKLSLPSNKLFSLNKFCKSSIYVTKKKGDNITSSNICSLCLEKHKIKDIVKTSCGHYFGKLCFANLVKHEYEKRSNKIICPNCRCKKYSLQCFKC